MYIWYIYYVVYIYIYIQKGQCEQIFVELRLKGAFLQLGPYIQKASIITSPPSTVCFQSGSPLPKRRDFFGSETQDVGPQNRPDLGWDLVKTAGKHHGGKEFQ